MKNPILILAVTLCSVVAYGQEIVWDEPIVVEDSLAIADSVAEEPVVIDPLLEAVDETYETADTLAVEPLAVDSLADDTVKFHRRKEIHPLRRGSYFHLGIGAGVSWLTYNVDAGTNSILPSLTANFGYTYFFLPWMGIGTGIHVSQYGSVAHLTDELGRDLWSNVTDSDGDTYNHRVQFNKWRERQIAYVAEIPLALHFQQNWGYRTGLYAQIGAKFGLPFYSDYKVIGGSINHVGDYESTGDVLGGRGTEAVHEFKEVENAGQGREILNIQPYDSLQYKYNVSAFFEIGALIQLSQRTDMFIGVYANYGFMNIDPLDDSQKVNIGFRDGENYKFMEEYKGVLATPQAHKIGINNGLNALSGGLKIGFHFYASKLKDEKKKEEEPVDTIPVVEEVVVDTIVPVDTILPEVLPEPIEPVEMEEPAITEVSRIDTIETLTQSLDDILRNAVIFFDFDKYAPKLEPADILDRVAEVLKSNRDMGIEINGHACSIGSDSYNQRLSKKRAQAVFNMLADKGVNSSQMKVQSFGSAKPFRYNDFEHQKSKDRRVEIVPIGYIDEMVQDQHRAEAKEAKTNDEGIVNQTQHEIPLVEIDGVKVPIFLKYTEFIGEETVKRGMSFAQLSRKWYNGGTDFWVYIFEANMYQVPDPNEIEPGTVLMIPKVPDDLVNPNNPQSVELARQLKEKYLKMSRTHSVSQSQSAAQTAQPTAKYTEFIGEEIVKRGMNLAQLSRKYYNGETAFWIYIYEANMHQISNPNDIELGTVIRIPKLAPELIDPNNPKCVEDAIKLKKQLVK